MILFAVGSRIQAYKLFEILLPYCSFGYFFYMEFKNARLCLKATLYISAAEMIIEPAQNMRDGLEIDPKYAAMMQQVVGRISTRPGGTQEMGPVCSSPL
jgi:hypothetical protein